MLKYENYITPIWYQSYPMEHCQTWVMFSKHQFKSSIVFEEHPCRVWKSYGSNVGRF
jgi:hypothetical protein